MLSNLAKCLTQCLKFAIVFMYNKLKLTVNLKYFRNYLAEVEFALIQIPANIKNITVCYSYTNILVNFVIQIISYLHMNVYYMLELVVLSRGNLLLIPLVQDCHMILICSEFRRHILPSNCPRNPIQTIGRVVLHFVSHLFYQQKRTPYS